LVRDRHSAAFERFAIHRFIWARPESPRFTSVKGVVVELVEIIRGGQDAMDRGDYRLAAAACSHVLEAYPSCLTAHRMLGEAHLEQGQTGAAIDHFNRAIDIDPLNVVSRLGLGVAAEENKAMGDAYAAYLHAWEINPALDQVRDELVRLRGLLGGDERLHPTRPGLAGIFIRGGQFGRAAAEWRAVLQTEPENQRAGTSLAEVLWRSGDDAGAAAACRTVLRDQPESARCLGILAEIETRRSSAAAAELVERYQFVDPTGEILALLSEWRDDLDLSFLRRESMALTDFDFAATPAADRLPVPAPASQSNAIPGLGSSQFGAPDLWDTLVRDFKPGEQPYTAEITLDADVKPFSWQEEPDPAASQNHDPFTDDALLRPAVPATSALVAAQPAITTGNAESMASFEAEFAALSGNGARMSASDQFSGATAELPQAEFVPPAMPTTPAKPTAKPATDRFVTADGRVDLTVGWDDLDRQLRDATPNFDNASEMDALAAQLGVAGIQPFEMGDSPFDESAWAPFTDDDLGASAPAAQASNAAVPPAPAQLEQPSVVPDREERIEAEFDLEPFTFPTDGDTAVQSAGWEMDDELLSAIPPQQASGYTELLRHVDIELPQAISHGEEVNPFANPDSAGTPLEFEDLLAVTSRDGTAPLHAVGERFETVNNESDLWAEELAAVKQMAESGWPANTIPTVPDQIPFEFSEPTHIEHSVDDALPTAFAQQPADDGLDAMLAGLGDVVPFALDDKVLAVTDDRPSDIVDFSDINDAPFDPSSLPSVVLVPPTMPAALQGWQPDVAENVAVESSAAWDVVEIEQGNAVNEVATGESVVAEPSHEQAALAQNGNGTAPRSVAWPSFVSHTSQLIDRSSDRGNLFARLRDGKRAAVATGLASVERSLSGLRPQSQQSLNVMPAVQVQTPGPEIHASPSIDPRPARFGTLSEEERLDLMAMRIRLIEDDNSAGEIARTLEGAIARGSCDPLSQRVLGEAYLKLGRTDQAANQFRNAMLARQRVR
jgi:Flp pilus assembly protein TadD